MTNQEILEKAIKKAIDGGWKEQGIRWMFQFHELVDMKDFDMSNPNNFNVLIYNLDFAKALWGEEEIQAEDTWMYPWAYHLRQMVVSDDPIHYLGENI